MICMQPQDSLQHQFAKHSICYGCGPANDKGLQLKSFVDGDKVIATFQPQSHHQAFPGVLNGGIIGTLLDCHCNWAACWYLMLHQRLDTPPCTVTSEYTIKLKRPTPVDRLLHMKASCQGITDNTATIKGQLIANNKLCDECIGTFVVVKSDHPAYHRW